MEAIHCIHVLQPENIPIKIRKTFYVEGKKNLKTERLKRRILGCLLFMKRKGLF